MFLPHPPQTLTSSEDVALMGVVAKGGVVDQFLGMLQTCPGFLIPKLGNYAEEHMHDKAHCNNEQEREYTKLKYYII